LGKRLAAVALLVLAVGTGTARADGDPASDVLLSQNLFLPADRQPSLAAEQRLNQAVDSASKGRLRIRVAIIATPADLGSVPVLYRQPKRYARFLGQELAFVYTQRLLVVMPNGYGLWRKRPPPPARELAAVDALPPPDTTDGTALALAADRAVRRLLALHGLHVVAPPPPARPPSRATSDRLEIAVGVLVLGALAAALWLVRRALSHG
jgi:hypothetical protein